MAHTEKFFLRLYFLSVSLLFIILSQCTYLNNIYLITLNKMPEIKIPQAKSESSKFIVYLQDFMVSPRDCLCLTFYV